MADAYEVDGDNLYSESDEEHEELAIEPFQHAGTVSSSRSPSAPVVRRSASKFPSFRHGPTSGEQFRPERSFSSQYHPPAPHGRPNTFPKSKSHASNGPFIHPDRLRHFDRSMRPSQHGRPRNSLQAAPHTEVVISKPISDVASILPDDELKDEILAMTSKVKREEPSVRKRPGIRKRRVSEVGESADTSSPARKQKVARPAGGLGQFGDLRSLAMGSVFIPEPEKPHPPQVSPQETQTRKLPRDVYREATITKESLELEARREAEEIARIDEAYRLQRKAERQERRVLAEQMRKDRTVSAEMRDNYELERVECYLFGDNKGRQKNSLESLDLKLKELGTDSLTEDLWTIIIEVI